MIHFSTLIVIPSGGGKSVNRLVATFSGYEAFDIDSLWAGDPVLRQLKKIRLATERNNYAPENERVQLLLTRMETSYDAFLVHHPGEIGSFAGEVPTLVVIPSRTLILDNLRERGDTRSIADQIKNLEDVMRIEARPNITFVHTFTNDETTRYVTGFIMEHAGTRFS